MFRTSLFFSLFIIFFSSHLFAQGVDAVEAAPLDDSELLDPNELENPIPVEATTPPTSTTPAPAATPETQAAPFAESEELSLDQVTTNQKPTALSQETSRDYTQMGSVILETPIDYTLPYQERRTRHGFVFGLTSENFYPFDYQSQFADKYIEDIIGLDSSFKLNGIELGYKYNVSVGSIAALFAYGQGSVDGITAGESLTLTKQALELNVTIDAIFSEPWVAPYAQVGMHQFTMEESRVTESKAAAANYALNFRYGLLFQLDWIESSIDKNAKAERLQSSGLENTYIDVYYAQYEASSQAQDAASLGVQPLAIAEWRGWHD